MPVNQDFKGKQDLQENWNKSEIGQNSSEKALILVIDDTFANLKLVSDFLRKAGFDVLVAKSGYQALKTLEKSSPDLILLDVLMPEMDGFETCRRLKLADKTKDIPVIFMTAVVD
ncbi:MAG: response regulator, partial [Coleofasciculus sp. S288]|nr:response regulator [Coleofasciculus sp. S288]